MERDNRKTREREAASQPNVEETLRRTEKTIKSYHGQCDDFRQVIKVQAADRVRKGSHTKRAGQWGRDDVQMHSALNPGDRVRKQQRRPSHHIDVLM